MRCVSVGCVRFVVLMVIGWFISWCKLSIQGDSALAPSLGAAMVVAVVGQLLAVPAAHCRCTCSSLTT